VIGRLLLTSAVLLLPIPALADTLVDNIEGISVDRQGKLTRFVAMVIGDDGRIKQILNRRADAPRVDFREDGKGRVVIPGIIDSHSHVIGLGLGQISLDLSETNSLDEALSRLAAYAAAHPENPWIVGHGWNQERWGLNRFPTAAELDAVVPDRGVWLTRVDGHAGWANTTALTAAEITARTADPAGGRILRTAGSRAPAGVLVDEAMALVEAKVPPPRPQDRDQALHEAQELLLRNGVTAVADMGTSIDDWMAYRRAGDLGTLRIRIMAYADSVPTMLLVGGTGPTPWLYDDRLRLNGIKLLLDGALGSRGALLKAPYSDDPTNKGIARLNGTQLRNLISRASMSNFQVAIHAIGDAANDEALFAIEDLSDDFTGDRRWRIEHAQIVQPADISRFGQHGIIASMQPAHQTSDWKMAEARLGPDRLAGAYAWRSISKAGAPMAFGSDAPVEAPNPFAGMAAAISREDAAGQPFGGWQGEERVTLEQALAAYTAGGAYAGFAEGRFGRLEEGERADFVMIDRDPFLADPSDLRNIRVLETWVGGQKLYQANGRAPQPARRPAVDRDDRLQGPQDTSRSDAAEGLESGR